MFFSPTTMAHEAQGQKRERRRTSHTEEENISEALFCSIAHGCRCFFSSLGSFLRKIMQCDSLVSVKK